MFISRLRQYISGCRQSFRRYLARLAVVRPLLATSPRFRAAIFDALTKDGRMDLIYSNKGNEKFILHTADKVICRAIYIEGEFELAKLHATSAVLQSLGRHPATIVDVGANIGSICVPAITRRLFSQAIAIEPEPTNVRVLKANIALNDLETSIKVLPVAAGAQSGKHLGLRLSTDNYGDHRIAVEPGCSEVIMVESMAIDDLALDARDVLLWVDAQGYEGFILEGAARLVEDRVPMVLEFWPDGLRGSGCFDSLLSRVRRYEYCYDLNTSPPRRYSTSSLGNLASALGEGQTDLIFV